MQRLSVFICQSEKTMRFLDYISILIWVFTTGCSKSGVERNCDKLKSAIVNSDKEKARDAITAFIRHMQDRNYTDENLRKLANEIDSECDINTTVLCFDCILTLPGQSEIMLSFQSGSSTLTRVIDISYSPDNKMKFSNMHE